MGCFRTSSGQLLSRFCRRLLGAGDARGTITGESWRGSLGDTARDRHGGIFRRSSAPGTPFGSVISAGQRMEPTSGCLTLYVLRGCSDPARTAVRNSCCRSTRRLSGPISTLPVHESSPLSRRTLWSPPGTQGAPPNYTNLPVEPADRALGRSRGGLSTKIHALTDDRTRPVTVILTGGQAGDNPQLVPLLDLHRRQSPPGQVRRFRLLADRAYSHPSTRQQLRHRRIAHTIPERQDQKDRRKAKGSKGGRPPGFDKDSYMKRNTVERGFLRLKQWRGIASRFDKHALTYLGGVILAAIVAHVRTN